VTHPQPDKSDPQEVYARWLDALTYVAFAFAAVALALYLSGALAPFVSPQALVELWRLPVDEYLARAGAPSGWAWLPLVGRGDYLNLAGVCLFALISLVCCARVTPAFLRRGEPLHAALAAAQVLVHLAAALNQFPRAR
jgi:hypothetical protein